MTRRRKVIFGMAAVLPIGGRAGAAELAQHPVNTLGSAEDVAIRGYDPVAYFSSGGPQAGLREHASLHGGARWLFACAENKALFAANPERYLPKYNGFCAYGTALGYLVKIEPDAWSIVDGRLYLNYNLDIRSAWLADPGGYIRVADMKWPQLTSVDIRA